MLDSSEVYVAGRGALYRCPLDTPQPAGPDAVLDPDCLHLGYFTTDGVEAAHEDSSTDIFAWQNAQLVRTVVNESKITLAFQPIQTRGSVLETFYPGSNVTDVGGYFEMRIRPRISAPYTWVFDVADGDNVTRWWIPRADLTERGSLMFQNEEPVGYPMTLTLFPVTDPENADEQVLAVPMSTDPAWGEGLLVTSP